MYLPYFFTRDLSGLVYGVPDTGPLSGVPDNVIIVCVRCTKKCGIPKCSITPLTGVWSLERTLCMRGSCLMLINDYCPSRQVRWQTVSTACPQKAPSQMMGLAANLKDGVSFDLLMPNQVTPCYLGNSSHSTFAVASPMFPPVSTCEDRVTSRSVRGPEPRSVRPSPPAGHHFSHFIAKSSGVNVSARAKEVVRPSRSRKKVTTSVPDFRPFVGDGLWRCIC